MKNRRKTKLIEKESRKNKKKIGPQDEQRKGEPELKSLSDFVTALTPVYASRPIFTGGRILQVHGKLFASCNQDIAVYDLSTKSSLPKIKIDNEEIVNFAVNLLGTKIAAYSQNGLLRIIDVNTSITIQIAKLNSKLFPNDMSFSADSKYLAIGFASQNVKIFTVQTLKQTHNYQHSAPVKKVEWNPHPETMQVISSDYNRKLIIFDYIANKVVGQVQAGHTFCLGTNGKRIISINDKDIRVYEYKGLSLIQSFNSGHYLQTVYAFGDMVLFGGEQTELMAWKIGTDQVGTVEGGTENGVMKILGWQKERKCIIVSTEQNLTIIETSRLTPQDIIVGYNDEIIDIKYSKGQPSDYFLLITNSSNAKIMNRQTNSLRFLLEGHQDIVLCGEYWHPWIVTAGKDKLIKLWRINEVGKPRLVANYRGHSDDVCGIGWMPKSHLFVTVGQDKTIKLWSLCQAADETVEIHSALNTVMGHEKTINAVRVSHKDELIATCSHDRSVRVWDKNLTKLFTLTGHRRGVWDAAFHDKEALLVTAGGDGMLKGWSMIDGSCVWSMGEGAGLVRCQWIYEHQVVTGSVDGILKLWDIRKKTSLSYDKHEGKIWALQVRKNQNGKCEIATGANDSVFQIWMDSTDETRGRILKQGQLQQKQKVMLDQFRYEGQYLEAAKVAFDGNYTQLFMQIVQEMLGASSEERIIEMDDQGAIVEEPRQIEVDKMQEDVTELINYTLGKDVNRLLNLVLLMNSTVRHFKAANKLFIEILKQHKLKGLLKVNKQFMLPQIKEEFDQKQTDFQKFLKNMLMYSEKHQARIEKYVRGSYWLDHLRELENPLAI